MMQERTPQARVIVTRPLKTDAYVWRKAIEVVEENGADAGFAAALRADALLAQYDVDGYLLWKGITKAVKELQRPTPHDGERLN